MKTSQFKFFSAILLTVVILLNACFCSSCRKIDDVEKNIRMLKNDDPIKRVAAAEQLGKVKDVRAIKPLAKALTDSDWRVRQASARALGCIKDVRIIEFLSNALKDPKIDVRLSATEALGEIQDFLVVEPLSLALKDRDWHVRMAAVKALSHIKDARVVEPLIATLDDVSSDVTSAAKAALHDVNNVIVVHLLTKRLTDVNSPIYQHLRAADTLAEFGPPSLKPLITGLSDKDQSVRFSAAEALGQIKDPRAVEMLLDTMKKDSYSRIATAKALVEIGNLSVEGLIRALQEESQKEKVITDGRVRVRIMNRDEIDFCVHIVRALGQIGDRRAVDPLISALGDEYEEVREAAADALGNFNDPRAVEPLILALKNSPKKSEDFFLNDNDAEFRESAARSLGRIKDLCAVEPLIAALKDNKFDHSGIGRGYVALALGEIKDLRAVDPLIAALKDENSSVRANAAIALASIGDQSAIPSLIASMPDWNAGKAIASALKQFNWQPQTEAEKVHAWISMGQHEQLIAEWEQARRILLEDVQKHDKIKTQAAVYTFINEGDVEVIPDLVEILMRSDDMGMAGIYLNCGHSQLEDAARKWAEQHGFIITESPGNPGIIWGARR